MRDTTTCPAVNHASKAAKPASQNPATIHSIDGITRTGSFGEIAGALGGVSATGIEICGAEGCVIAFAGGRQSGMARGRDGAVLATIASTTALLSVRAQTKWRVAAERRRSSA